MKLEQQVTSLELSRRLKELGVKQESLFCWESHAASSIAGSIGLSRDVGYREDMLFAGECSAFTVSELGEILKRFDSSDKNAAIFYPPSYDIVLGTWVSLNAETSNTEADARAKMLIHLIKRKLITL